MDAARLSLQALLVFLSLVKIPARHQLYTDVCMRGVLETQYPPAEAADCWLFCNVVFRVHVKNVHKDFIFFKSSVHTCAAQTYNPYITSQ